MSEHEQVRGLIPLAAAGTLDAAEQARVEVHVQGCEECTREFETWRAYAQGLREMPDVVAPAWLAERTLARMRAQSTALEDRMWSGAAVFGLAAFGWATSVAGWFVVREFAPVGFIVWSVGWMAVGWLTAGVAAVMLGKDRDRRWVL